MDKALLKPRCTRFDTEINSIEDVHAEKFGATLHSIDSNVV